jgi:hypothetical protein
MGELPNMGARLNLRMPVVRMSKKAIEDRLRSETPARSAPDGLTERVMSRLPAHEAEADRMHAGSLFWPRFALGIATVAIALVIAGEFWRRSEPGTANVAANNHSIQAEKTVAALQPVEITIPTITPEQIQALTERIDQPLEKELKNVISDTRLAIQFVASNFIPEQ